MGTIDTINANASSEVEQMGSATQSNFIGAVRTFANAVAVWSQKRRSRSDLRELTDDQLRDIGLTSRDVQSEVCKSFFWD